MKKLTLNITHLYPRDMNIYGDIGNIITLVNRAKWRDISVEVNNIGKRDKLPKNTDIYFMGGGQDKDQVDVFKDFLAKQKNIIDDIEAKTAFLAICGSYQLLGKSFITGNNNTIEGIGLLDIETKALDANVKNRCIGNIAAILNDEVFKTEKMVLKTIVGFENHSGQTYLGKSIKPLAKVIKGYGNNFKDKTEGCIYKNLIGTYMHGSFLPKNPHMADFLIHNALIKKYKGKVNLSPLNDSAEIKAHYYILNKLGIGT